MPSRRLSPCSDPSSSSSLSSFSRRLPPGMLNLLRKEVLFFLSLDGTTSSLPYSAWLGDAPSVFALKKPRLFVLSDLSIGLDFCAAAVAVVVLFRIWCDRGSIVAFARSALALGVEGLFGVVLDMMLRVLLGGPLRKLMGSDPAILKLLLTPEEARMVSRSTVRMHGKKNNESEHEECCSGHQAPIVIEHCFDAMSRDSKNKQCEVRIRTYHESAYCRIL